MATKSLEERIQRLEDIHEIKNLMARYEYLHTAGMHKECADLFALKSPDVRTEIASWGVWEVVTFPIPLPSEYRNKIQPEFVWQDLFVE